MLLNCVILTVYGQRLSKLKTISDNDIHTELLSKNKQLIANGQTVPITDLVAQLDRRQCEIRLKERGRLIKRRNLYSYMAYRTLIVNIMFKIKDMGPFMAKSTAFVISKDGLCVANSHLFEQLNNAEYEIVALTVADYDGNVYPITELLASHPKDDIAIFKIETNKKMKFVRLSTKGRIGQEIYTLSNPNEFLFYMTKGIISSKRLQRGRKTDRFGIDADFAKNSSGGPIFDNKGNVLAVVGSTNSIYYEGDKKFQMTIKECIPVDAIFKLIKQ